MNKACERCPHNAEGTNLECAVYGIPPTSYMNAEMCPVNPPEIAKGNTKKLNPLKAAKRAKRGH